MHLIIIALICGIDIEKEILQAVGEDVSLDKTPPQLDKMDPNITAEINEFKFLATSRMTRSKCMNSIPNCDKKHGLLQSYIIHKIKEIYSRYCIDATTCYVRVDYFIDKMENFKSFANMINIFNHDCVYLCWSINLALLLSELRVLRDIGLTDTITRAYYNENNLSELLDQLKIENASSRATH